VRARESGGGALEIEGATEKRSAISSPSEGVMGERWLTRILVLGSRV
jgi:hypothetical protein